MQNLSFLSGGENKTGIMIHELAGECIKGEPDLSGIQSELFELIRCRPDAPVGAIWGYFALTFEKHRFSADAPHKRISAAADLFQLLAACSSSCTPAKSVALLAPLALEVFTAVSDAWESLYIEKKLAKKIDSLLGAILGYVCIHFSRVWDCRAVCPVPELVDLVRIWVSGRREEKKDDTELLQLFFPLTSQGIIMMFNSGEVDINYLTGVVAVEFLLLRLCLKFQLGFSVLEVQDTLRTSVVGCLNSSKNYYFFEILMRVLLEPNLPVTSLLSCEDELLLRRIMYDAVILVEYSFLKLNEEAQSVKTLALTRLILSHEAIESCRESGNVKKAAAYESAFSESTLYLKLIKVIRDEITEEVKEKPSRNSPQGLLKWLLNLENRGIKIFNDVFLKNCRKLFASLMAVDAQKSRVDDMFFIDHKGEEENFHMDKGDNEMDEGVNAVFIAASHTIKADKSTRKRRIGRREEDNAQMKLAKYDVEGTTDSSSEEPLFVEGEESGSEVDNPTSNGDSEQ